MLGSGRVGLVKYFCMEKVPGKEKIVIEGSDSR